MSRMKKVNSRRPSRLDDSTDHQAAREICERARERVGSGMDEDGSAAPRDARTIEAILHSMGVTDYDPRVVHQLLEFLYRYVSTILTDSRAFADHADKPQIDVDDIKLAVRSRCSHAFSQPPPRDVTMRLAAERNAVPLPPVDVSAGVALPPPQFQLTAQNYDIVIDRAPAAASPKRPRLSASPRTAAAAAASVAAIPTPPSASAAAPSTKKKPAGPAKMPPPPQADVMILDPPSKPAPASRPPQVQQPATAPASSTPSASMSVSVPGSTPVPASSNTPVRTPKLGPTSAPAPAAAAPTSAAVASTPMALTAPAPASAAKASVRASGANPVPARPSSASKPTTKASANAEVVDVDAPMQS